jgi:hypothetical protein
MKCDRFVQGFKRINQPITNERRTAFAMGWHHRLGGGSDVYQHFFHSPLYDQKLLDVLWKFVGLSF